MSKEELFEYCKQASDEITRLQEKIDKAIEYLNKINKQNYGAISNPESTIISKQELIKQEIENNNILLEILGDKDIEFDVLKALNTDLDDDIEMG